MRAITQFVRNFNRQKVVGLLNISSLALGVMVAVVVAVPLALVFIGRWVEGYAYKAAAPWWLFACAGVLVLTIAVSTVGWQSYRAATANPVESLKSE